MSESRRGLVPMPALSVVSATTSVAQAGKLNRLNATAANVAVNLPDVDGLGFGTRLQIQKFDSSAHLVTITVAAGDEIADQATTIVLSRPLELVELQVISDTWQIVANYLPAGNGTLVTTLATQELRGKIISGTHNTLSDISPSALGVGKVTGVDADGDPTSYKVAGITASEYAGLAVKQPDTFYIVVP